MEIYFKGGDTEDASRFEPSQLPSLQNQDIVIFDQCTEDVICNKVPMWYGLKMTNFLADIYYNFADYHQSGVFRNEERYNLFIYRQDILRVD